MTQPTNDNDATHSTGGSGKQDADGQAAMLLVESLIHALIAQSILSREDAIELVTVAIDARIEIAADTSVNSPTVDKSLTLLTAIRSSLRADHS